MTASPQPAAAAAIEAAMRAALDRHKAGKFEEAAGFYRDVLKIDAGNANALNNLAVALRKLGREAEARDLLQEAVRRHPRNADAHYNLGNGYLAAGQNEEAARCYAKAVECNPRFVAAFLNLGIAQRRDKKAAEAAATLTRGVAVAPENAAMHLNLALALEDAGHYRAAVAHVVRAEALATPEAALQQDLAAAELKLDRYAPAERAARRAVAATDPPKPEPFALLGQILCSQGRYAEALAPLRRALELDPENLTAHLGLARSLLLKGDLKEGWVEYHWRWKHRTSDPFPKHDKPLWDGGDLNGKTILLHTEQGLGDTIHFIRYAPLLVQRGATVLVRCQPVLADLVRRVPGVARVLAPEEPPPPFDCYSPLLELPRRFGTDLTDIPDRVPYIDMPTPAERPGGRPQIGLVWGGSREHENDRNRSIALKELLPILELPRLRFVSLQKDDFRRAEMPACGAGGLLADLGPRLQNFVQTAEAILRLDLVVTVDTAVAHLAGALARPVWMFVPFVPDWRWLNGRADTPWYPTMRLYRQAEPMNWAPTIARVREDLIKRFLAPAPKA